MGTLGCEICPRRCGARRDTEQGACGAGALARVARAKPHHWEEPCISGTRGSGAIFFCGCNLRCVFCQNEAISRAPAGRLMDEEALAFVMRSLEERGAHNINLVTPAPHAALVARALERARGMGLKIPIVYNTNAYERVETLRLLDGLVDVYLPDFKYATAAAAERYSGAADYPQTARRAIKEMLRQCGTIVTDEEGLAQKGVLIRHLVLPGNLDETRGVLSEIAGDFGVDCFLSLMGQYTPHTRNLEPPLNRKLSRREYERAQECCERLGFTNVYIQELSSADSSFVPDFTQTDWEGFL